jgi:aminodeoxyfutalosine synthase
MMLFSDPNLEKIQARLQAGERLNSEDGLALFNSSDLTGLGQMADAAAQKRHGHRVTYVLNRHCNPTNVCTGTCAVCDFRRKKGEPGAWEYTLEEVLEHAQGPIREIHLTGGLHPDWSYDRYLGMITALRQSHPRLSIKAFTAVEIDWLSRISGRSSRAVLSELKKAGLDLLAGGGAEIFAEAVRKKLFKDKISGERWLAIHAEAHALGLRSNATMLFGHIESYADRVDHLLKIRALQDQSPGFLSFIPLSFQKGRTGITPLHHGGVDDLKTLAVSRLLLDNLGHLKAYWVMLGEDLASAALNFGADDLDGTIGKETIAHAALAPSPQGLTKERLEHLIKEAGKTPVERDSFYDPV